MPDVDTKVELPIPDELRDTLVEGWEGTLEVEGEIESVRGGLATVRITGVYASNGDESKEGEFYKDVAGEEMGEGVPEVAE